MDVGFAVEDFVVSEDRLRVGSEYGLFEGRIASIDLDSGAVDPLIETGTGMIHTCVGDLAAYRETCPNIPRTTNRGSLETNSTHRPMTAPR